MFLLQPAAWGHSRSLPPVAAEIASNHFLVTIDGQQTPVMHAALNLYFLNFEAHRHMKISVTAPTDDFWTKGVEVQPWRLGIRPQRSGRVLTFTLDGPAQITISRPGDFLTQAEMLCLFANPPTKHTPIASRPGLRYIGPGAHTENIDAQTGDSIYLAPGAVVFGSLNVWGVDHVKVFGPGVIVYDGPQNPANDDGWMHKRNWHCIVMDNAHDIVISDITCVVRSRTWQIQMKDSRGITYDNIKVIGANAGNANADGMDWLGGGDTVIRNSFFRAADDIFAMQSSWEGYGPVAFAVQGSPVTNITVENSVLSTTVSNIVRAGWPQKNFEGGGFHMRNADVLHMGLGGCGIPFALMEFWADPAGRGHSAGYDFTDIRLEDWYSLVQLQTPTAVHDVHFTDIAALTMPSLVPSLLKGDVKGVTLDNAVLAGNRVTLPAEVPLEASAGAASATVSDTGPRITVVKTQGWLKPHQPVLFEAQPENDAAGLHYTWIFGDGTTARGRKVKHRFPDEQGTLLDGSGLYRVLLHVSNSAARQTWMDVPTVVRDVQMPALTGVSLDNAASENGTATGHTLPGVTYRVSSTLGTESETIGTAPSVSLAAVPHPEANYLIAFATDLQVPEDGGYIFTIIANDASSLVIDGKPLGTGPAPFAQVCGLAGNAARPFTAAVELAKGSHHVEIRESHGVGVDNFQALWQGPGIPLSGLPASRLTRLGSANATLVTAPNLPLP